MGKKQNRIPGTDMFSLSRWLRENEPKPPPAWKVGDHVVLVIPAEVLAVCEDCDGTPVYRLSPGSHGWNESFILPGDPNDWLIDDPATLARMAAERSTLRGE